MKKRFSAIIFALALCVGLAVPAFAAFGPPVYKVSVSDPNGVVSKDMSFTLRGITEETSMEDGLLKMRFTYTRNKETETVHLKDVPVLSPDASIIVNGLRTDIDVNDWVDLYAWSDPDGDGIFNQQLIIGIGAIPTLEEGPFENQWGDGGTGYLTDILLSKSNSLDSGIEPGSMSQPTIELSADFITNTFGPNTLIKLEMWTRTAPQDGGWLYDRTVQGAYMFYVPGETSVGPAPTTFTDVPAGEWYADPVAWAVEKEITNGTGNGKFSPGQNCTEAQILTFLYRAARGEGAATADDMNKAISWAREKSMIDDTFDGNKFCTRATAVNYIWQAFDKPTAKASSFVDVHASAAYVKAVNWAVEKKVTNGTNPEGTMFSPDEICTRGHIVTFLYRAYNN